MGIDRPHGIDRENVPKLEKRPGQDGHHGKILIERVDFFLYFSMVAILQLKGKNFLHTDPFYHVTQN